jgi:hypothetical protein
VKAESQKLRAEGCDYIVFAVHDGVSGYGSTGTVDDGAMASFYDAALSNGYVDLVFESHTHQNYILQDSHGVYHIQAGGENTAISHVEIKLNFANDLSEVRTIETVRAYVYDDFSSDPIVDELKEKYKDEIAKGSEMLGILPRSISDDELRQLCADLYLEKGLAKWGKDYNIVLGGGYVGVRSPYKLYAGETRYEDVYSIFPFDNELYLCSILGRDLKNKFLYTSNSNYFICQSDYGQTVTINDYSTYYIITDSYSAFYAPNRLTRVAAYGEELFARDMIAEYIKNGGFGATMPDDNEENENTDAFEITSISDVLLDVNLAGANVEIGPYYVLGTIIDDPQATYGNCTIRDLDGNEIYIYGLYGQYGDRYDALLDEQPKKGDTVLVFGNALLYQKNAASALLPELKNVKVQKVFKTVSIPDATAAGNALEDNAVTAEEFTVIGKIAEAPHATYGNTTLTDADGNTLYIYGLYNETGSIRYDSFGTDIKIGDTVIVRGHVKKYVKTGSAPLIEIENGKMLFFDAMD